MHTVSPPTHIITRVTSTHLYDLQHAAFLFEIFLISKSIKPARVYGPEEAILLITSAYEGARCVLSVCVPPLHHHI